MLNALQSPPFEPLHQISLEFLTLKTTFLLALASGSRRSEIHALDIGQGRIQWLQHQVVLRTHPKFIAKNQVLGSVASPIIIKDLATLVGRDRKERLLCPVRSLKWYCNRTKDIRGDRTRLFIPWKSDKMDCTTADISKWIVNTIKVAYSSSTADTQALSKVTAHEVRAVATSWALWAGVSIKSVIEAGTWHSQNSFISFYLWDMAQEAVRMSALGPISSAQNVAMPFSVETPSTN